MSSYSQTRPHNQPKPNAVESIKSAWENAKKFTLVQWLILIIGGAVIVTVLALNWQPWLYLGVKVADSITSIPLLGWLTELWLIGPAIKALTQNTAQFVGLALWAACQFVQSIPLILMAQRKPVPAKLWWFYAASYVCELMVTMLLYPIYGDGIGDFFGDFLRWDSYYRNGDQIVLFVTTFASFEVVVGATTYLFYQVD